MHLAHLQLTAPLEPSLEVVLGSGVTAFDQSLVARHAIPGCILHALVVPVSGRLEGAIHPRKFTIDCVIDANQRLI